METITQIDASELAQKIKAGDISAQEVIEAHIQRIKAVNDKLNAVVMPLFDEALAQAKEADQKRQNGEALGPLPGVPITISWARTVSVLLSKYWEMRSRSR